MSRSTILHKIGLNKPDAKIKIPDFAFPQNDETDLKITFVRNLAAAGAQVIEIDNSSSIEKVISDLSKNASHVVDLYSNSTNISSANTSIDLAIIRGALGVAENGAIWVDSNSIPQATIPFICESLVIILSSKMIVNTMHDAYFNQSEIDYDWGTFIAGPSKTADIEQTLVIGAQGAMKLTVIIPS